MFQRSFAVWMSLAGLFGLSACKPPDARQEPVRAVKLLQVQTSDVAAGLEFAGEVRARVESRLGFRVAGKLIARHVELGQRVKVGQLLAELDPRDYELATDAARAQVRSAQTQLELAQADFKRYKELKDQSFISGAELERRESTLKAAQAQYDQAQAQLRSQGNQVGYTRLLADHAGVVTAIESEVGQVLLAGTPVIRLAQEGANDVVIALPEDKLGLLKVGQNVAVKPWNGGREDTARVRDVAASADPVTRTFTVKLGLPKGDGLALGSTVQVVLPRTDAWSRQPSIQLPTAALRQDGGKTAVWVLDPASMTVRSQTIEIGTADGNQVVVASGLQAGQEVVVAGVHVLSPGQKVTRYTPQSVQPLGATQTAPGGGPVQAAGAASAVSASTNTPSQR
ncbi:MAG: efflux RND transporter periplasmic adaptor subunit [Betaproteobacteria bacterium]|nr:efflux RND transporter periplasmic adaptor subunit [Betaproteobacteria bacterium]